MIEYYIKNIVMNAATVTMQMCTSLLTGGILDGLIIPITLATVSVIISVLIVVPFAVVTLPIGLILNTLRTGE